MTVITMCISWLINVTNHQIVLDFEHLNRCVVQYLKELSNNYKGFFVSVIFSPCF